MINGKGPAQMRRVNGVEIVLALRDVMGKIMDFRVFRLPVQILEQQEHPLSFRIADRAL